MDSDIEIVDVDLMDHFRKPEEGYNLYEMKDLISGEIKYSLIIDGIVRACFDKIEYLDYFLKHYTFESSDDE